MELHYLYFPSRVYACSVGECILSRTNLVVGQTEETSQTMRLYTSMLACMRDKSAEQ